MFRAEVQFTILEVGPCACEMKLQQEVYHCSCFVLFPVSLLIFRFFGAHECREEELDCLCTGLGGCPSEYKALRWPVSSSWIDWFTFGVIDGGRHQFRAPLHCAVASRNSSGSHGQKTWAWDPIRTSSYIFNVRAPKIVVRQEATPYVERHSP